MENWNFNSINMIVYDQCITWLCALGKTMTSAYVLFFNNIYSVFIPWCQAKILNITRRI